MLKQELTNYLKYCVLRIVDEIKFRCHETNQFTNPFISVSSSSISVKPWIAFFMLLRGVTLFHVRFEMGYIFELIKKKNCGFQIVKL